MDKQKTRTSISARSKTAMGFSVLAGTIVALCVIALWYALDQRAHEHASLATEHSVRMNQLLIRQDLNNRLAAMDRLAHRWTSAGGKPREEWEADATEYVSDMPGFESIQWIDSMMQAQWAVNASNIDQTPSLQFIGQMQLGNAIDAAQKSGEAVLTGPFEVDAKKLCLVMFLPVFRGQEFDGVIVGMLDTGKWLRTVISDLQDSDHHVQVLLQGKEVYRYDVGKEFPQHAHGERSLFEIHGLEWMILVTPSESFLSAGHADSSTLVLVVGLLFSVLVAIAVYLTLQSRHRSQQFRELATQLATLFKNLPGMAYRRSVELNEGSIDFVSEGCEALSGYPRSDFDAGRKNWLDIVHPDDRAGIISKVREAIAADDAFELEYRILDRSGGERWVWERGRTVCSDTDGSKYIDGFISDVTEQRAAESEARQLRENLAHVDRLNMLGEMATGIAHEINQPLTAISLFVQAGSRLAERGEQDRLAEIFDKLTRHAHRASAVIERMQTLARRHDSVKETISCVELIDEVAKLAEAEGRIRDIIIEVNTASFLPDVSVDTVQIQQVILNLLRNGMESMQSVDCRDGNVVALDTELHEDGSISISVVDRGTGVSDAVAATLFASFSTTKKSGMGMGLSISRDIVIAHGGRLDFFNNDSAGATFFFTLPPAD